MRDTFDCPVCYTELPLDAVVCPTCGSDEETGWSAEAVDTAWYPHEYEEEAVPAPTAAKTLFWPRKTYIVITLVTIFAFLVYAINLGFYFILFALLLVGAGYYWLVVRPEQPTAAELEPYEELLHKAQGNKLLAERWIAYERGRDPHATRLDHIQAAIGRWERRNE